MRILTTGATGFLGRHLVRQLLQHGHAVAAWVRPNSDTTALQALDVALMAKDPAAAVAEWQPDALVHCAGIYGRAGEPASTLLDVNVRLGLQLMEALKALPATTQPRLFLNAGSALAPDVSAYALSKHQLAAWGRQLADAHPQSLQVVNARLEHFFGAGDSPEKFTTRVLTACRTHAPHLDLTPGDHMRDFVFVDDAVTALAHLLTCHRALPAWSEVPVGSGQAVPVRDFVSLVHRLCESRTELRFGAVPLRPNEPAISRADLGPLNRLGWQPAWTLEAALRRTLEIEGSPT